MSPEPLVIAAPPATPEADPGFPQIPRMTDNVDLGELSTSLTDDRVAVQGVPAGVETPQIVELRKVVAHARDEGHDLSIVVITQQQPTYTIYRDIATTLQPEVGGTVIVLGPNSVGSTSPDFSRFQQEKATNDLDLNRPAVAARQMYDSMAEPTIDWTLVTLLLIFVVAIGAVIGRVQMLRRRRRQLPDVVAGPAIDASAAAPAGDEPVGALASSGAADGDTAEETPGRS
ncbi:hypothetical protein QSJ18_03720 [Gordonia sp. ABSL1-1]|uniref:Rv1476 family membrane protein n=1 Tax=Gordonia sp. ABSL1-1 TaxID=3053923 RepID=UPI0025728746|nr:DUF6676 family protein [Gordonia sp. ABSL1-1]MDL9935846.1 hypothetical protein [Gordonia sp. ABSL1-1]